MYFNAEIQQVRHGGGIKRLRSNKQGTIGVLTD